MWDHSQVAKPQEVMTQDLHESIIAASKRIKSDFLLLGAYLALAHRNEIWKGLGFVDWSDYIGQPEIGISKTTASKLMAIHRIWIEEHRVSPAKLNASIENLYKATHILKAKPHQEQDCVCEDLESDAKVLSRSDMQKKVDAMLGKEEKEQRKREVVCPHCGEGFLI